MRSRLLAVLPFAFLPLLTVVASAQPWSGILSPSRAIDWSRAGLPACIAYGTASCSAPSPCNGAKANCTETTPNPWTPPTRVQSGATITCTNSASDITNINNAIAAALPGSYVQLAPGTCNTNGTNVVLRKDGVTLRGSGPQSTTLTGSGKFDIQFGVCCGTGTGNLTATSYAAGSTSVTITGGTPAVGVPATFTQCDDGFSGTPCSGSYSDPGTVWVCGVDVAACSNNNGPSGQHQYQEQTVLVTAVSGSCASSCTVSFTPPLFMPNWSSNRTARLTWQNRPNWTYGNAVEDMTIRFPDNTTSGLDIQAAYGWWVKGNRIITSPLSVTTSIGGPSLQGLYMNNYVFGSGPTYFSSVQNEPVLRSKDTASLMLNNIVTGGNGFWGNGGQAGEVIAYNYSRDSSTAFYINKIINHNPFESFLLKEGNQIPQDHGDSTHGTNALNTSFREYLSGWDSPYWTQNPWSVELDNYNRFYNYVGNVLGGTRSTAYQGTSASDGYIWNFPTIDALARVSALRWGNVDTITGVAHWCGRTDSGFNSVPCLGSSEIPDSTTMSSSAFPKAASFQNPTPASRNLPCSFFLSSSSAPCTILPNGGTGLSWWKVCRSWSSFPTSCATTQTQPYPPIGPDQRGGPYAGGYAYDIPAAIAYTYLPIDSSLQSSYAITSSTWSNSPTGCATQAGAGAAPCEILTVSMSSAVNTGSVQHIMGGFQLSGVNAACIPAGLPPNNEILMTGSKYVNSSTIQVVYSLASNPGVQCAGSMKFPNIRQFDQRVYQSDPNGSAPPPPGAPTSLTATVQ